MELESSGEIASLELRLYPTLQPDRTDTTADLQRYLGIMSRQNIRHKAAALHQLPPKVEMILLKKRLFRFSSALFSLARQSRNALLVRRGRLLRGLNVSIYRPLCCFLVFERLKIQKTWTP